MKNTKYYICKYCYKEFEPKRRRVQKYCSNTCRSKAYHARKTSGTAIEIKTIPPNISEEPKQSEKMNLAGIGNATVGNLLAQGIKTVFTKEDEKPATKGDLKKFMDILEYRYLPIKNLPPNNNGEIPFYDVIKSEIIYLIC
ncbi:MAG: hypothetical protein ACX93I_09990 [Winogradskyella sp.]